MSKAQRGKPPAKRKLINGKHGNQYVSTPQQNLFLDNWLNPKSSTFGNAYQSAMNAGYSDSYARSLTANNMGNKWISEYINKNILQLEHIQYKLVDMINNDIDSKSKDDTRLKAIELYSKLSGYLVDKHQHEHKHLVIQLGKGNQTIDQ